MNFSEAEKSDFSQFGKSFQENLCQLILQDRAFSDQMREVMDVNFLELGYLRAFVTLVFEYREEYKVHPSLNIMTTLLRTHLNNVNELIQ